MNGLQVDHFPSGGLVYFPSGATITESLDPDLDASAVAAVSQWVFRPGTLDGVAVPVRVHVGMSFSIH